MPLIVGTLLLLVTAAITLTFVRREREHHVAAAKAQAAVTKKHIEVALRHKIEVLEHLAERWKIGGRIPIALWTAEVDHVLEKMKGIRYLTWVDEAGIIRRVPSAAHFEKVKNFNTSSDPDRKRVFDRARKTGAIAVSKVTERISGGRGFFIAKHVFQRGRPDGFLVLGIETQDFFEEVLGGGDSVLQISSDGKPIFRTRLAEDKVFDGQVPTASIAIDDLRMQVSLTPDQILSSNYSSLFPWTVFSAGSLLSVLVGLLLRSMYSVTQTYKLASATANWKRAIVNGLDMGVFSVGPDGLVKSFNPAAERILGYSADEVCGSDSIHLWLDKKELVDFLAIPPLNGRYVSLIEGVLNSEQNNKIFDNRWIAVRKNGCRINIRLTLHPVSVYGGFKSGFVGIVEDLSEKIQTESKIEAQKAQMDAVAKMSVLGEMAASIAHEINNPLTIIRFNLDALDFMFGYDGWDQVRAKKAIKGAQITVDRVAQIIRGLKMFARDSTHDPMILSDPAEIVSDTVAFCASKFRSTGVTLTFNPEALIQPILCRPSEISQVILNLLSNAYDAALKSSDKWVRIEAKSASAGVEVLVSDSGPGVPEDLHEKIMEPFFTTKGVGEGAGLGLSISKRIVETHGGTLQISAQSPHTTFMISLPLASRTKGPRGQSA